MLVPRLTHDLLITVLGSLIADELRGLRHQGSEVLNSDFWDAHTDLKSSPSIALDSLELISVATRVNVFFQLHRSGLEDYLLRATTLGEWADLVLAARERGTSDITFNTSGSTGDAKSCNHAWATLTDEVAWFAHLLPTLVDRPPTRIVALVPAHHIYGFLFTVLLPEQWGVPVLRGNAALSASFGGRLAAGDLIVGVPFHWQQLYRLGMSLRADQFGLTSTGPCDPAVIEGLLARGLAGMVEIYGSTESGGIGWRARPDVPFELLPRWQRVDLTNDELEDVKTNNTVSLSDDLAWYSDRQLAPQGRKDKAVQVGGINVFPDRIARALETVSTVAQASVRLMQPAEGDRLKAFVVPAEPGSDPTALTALTAQLHQWCQHNLRAAERPKAFSFGATLPTNDLSKASDWLLLPPTDSLP